jgi:hypothetical protein
MLEKLIEDIKLAKIAAAEAEKAEQASYALYREKHDALVAAEKRVAMADRTLWDYIDQRIQESLQENPLVS